MKLIMPDKISRSSLNLVIGQRALIGFSVSALFAYRACWQAWRVLCKQLANASIAPCQHLCTIADDQ